MPTDAQIKRFLSAKSVRERYDNKSEMWLWRVINHPDYAHLDFPKPIYINGIRHWDGADLDAWDEAQKQGVSVT